MKKSKAGMRVVAGIAGGIALRVSAGARPLLEMARNALFNSLTAILPDSKVLDLYAGSGALGIEALSRGAAFCVFVENNPHSATAIRENLRRCRFSDRGHIIVSRVEDALAQLTGRFQLIFADPPFARGSHWGELEDDRTIIEATAALLTADGRLVFRTEKRHAPPPTWGRLFLLQNRRYGRSLICLYGVAGTG